MKDGKDFLTKKPIKINTPEEYAAAFIRFTELLSVATKFSPEEKELWRVGEAMSDYEYRISLTRS